MGDQEVLMDIRERLVRVETKLDNYNGIKDKVDCLDNKMADSEARSRSNAIRIDRLEEANSWLWKTIVGTILTFVVAAAVALIK